MLTIGVSVTELPLRGLRRRKRTRGRRAVETTRALRSGELASHRPDPKKPGREDEDSERIARPGFQLHLLKFYGRQLPLLFVLLLHSPNTFTSVWVPIYTWPLKIVGVGNAVAGLKTTKGKTHGGPPAAPEIRSRARTAETNVINKPGAGQPGNSVRDQDTSAILANPFLYPAGGPDLRK